MGCWDLFCFICGNGTYVLPETEGIEKYMKELKWLSKITILTANDEVYHNCKAYSCNGEFITKNKTVVDANIKYGDVTNYFEGIGNKGIFCHDECWVFVKKTYGIDLKFSNLPIKKIIMKHKFNDPLCANIKYGDIANYWGQEYDFENAMKDNKMQYSISPLKDSKNGSRIKKIITQLKLKQVRTGPSVSATFYNDGDIKMGNNGKFWMKKNNKWNELGNKIMKKTFEVTFKHDYKKQYKIIDIPQIAETNNKPLFVKKYSYVKKVIKFDLVYAEEMQKEVDILFST